MACLRNWDAEHDRLQLINLERMSNSLPLVSQRDLNIWRSMTSPHRPETMLLTSQLLTMMDLADRYAPDEIQL
jgi:hypothetical protein